MCASSILLRLKIIFLRANEKHSFVVVAIVLIRVERDGFIQHKLCVTKPGVKNKTRAPHCMYGHTYKKTEANEYIAMEKHICAHTQISAND